MTDLDKTMPAEGQEQEPDPQAAFLTAFSPESDEESEKDTPTDTTGAEEAEEKTGEEEPAGEHEEDSDRDEQEEEEETEETEEQEEVTPSPPPEDLPAEYLDAKIPFGDAKVSVRDLVQGNLRQADYTRKTQALAEERKFYETAKSEMEKQREDLTQMVEFKATLEANPHMAQAIAHLFQGNMEAAVEAASRMPVQQPHIPQADPKVKQLEERLEMVEREEQERTLGRITAEFEEIRKKHPELTDEDMRRVAEQAQLMNTTSPWAAFKVIYWDKAIKEAKSKGAQEQLRKAKEGKRAATSSKTAGEAPTTNLPKDPKELFIHHFTKKE
jgi:hypothetical protein